MPAPIALTYSPAALASPTLVGTRVLQGLPADDRTVPYQQAADEVQLVAP